MVQEEEAKTEAGRTHVEIRIDSIHSLEKSRETAVGYDWENWDWGEGAASILSLH
jgi:hypothetical protein